MKPVKLKEKTSWFHRDYVKFMHPEKFVYSFGILMDSDPAFEMFDQVMTKEIGRNTDIFMVPRSKIFEPSEEEKLLHELQQ